MEKGSNPIIHIAAFSTKLTSNTPIDLLDIYLENNMAHTTPLKTKHTLTFVIAPFTDRPYSNTKISFCFITDLTQDHSHLKLANCYMIFFDLENEESKDQLEAIFSYINLNCNHETKIYLYGVISNIKESNSAFTKKDINEYLTLLDDFNYSYEDFELASEKKITRQLDKFLEVVTDNFYFGEKDENSLIDHPNNSNSGSCIIY